MYHKHRCAYDIFMNSFYCLEEDIITFECINETNWCVEKVDFPNFKHTIEKKHTHIHQKKHSAIECLCMIFYSMAYSRRRMLLSIEQYILDICFLNNARFFFIEINLWSCCTFGDYCSQNGLLFYQIILTLTATNTIDAEIYNDYKHSDFDERTNTTFHTI